MATGECLTYIHAEAGEMLDNTFFLFSQRNISKFISCRPPGRARTS